MALSRWASNPANALTCTPLLAFTAAAPQLRLDNSYFLKSC
jgi:hypothetical protein